MPRGECVSLNSVLEQLTASQSLDHRLVGVDKNIKQRLFKKSDIESITGFDPSQLYRIAEYEPALHRDTCERFERLLLLTSTDTFRRAADDFDLLAAVECLVQQHSTAPKSQPPPQSQRSPADGIQMKFAFSHLKANFI